MNGADSATNMEQVMEQVMVATNSPSPLTLRLYVAGHAPNSALARANLRAILDGYDLGETALEIVDCLREPTRALQDGVLVTPTLVRLSPQPTVMVVGTLGDRGRVIAALDLDRFTRRVDGEQRDAEGSDV